MVLFKDFAKPSADLLRKGFPHEKPWNLEYKYKSKNPQITNTATVNAQGGIDATSTLKYGFGDTSTEIKMLSNGKSHVDFSYKVRQCNGLSFGSKFERRAEKSSADALELTAEFNQPRLHTQLQVNPLIRNFNSSTAVCYKSLIVGSEISGKLDMSGMRYAIGASYTAPPCCKNQWMAGFRTAPSDNMVFGKIIGNVHAKSIENRGAEIAAEVEYNVADTKAYIMFGGLWYLNDNKDTYVKAKISQNSFLSMAVTHRLCDYVSATVGTQLDLSKFQNPECMKYGLKVDVLT